jgi:flagellar biosynthesis protein FlhB
MADDRKTEPATARRLRRARAEGDHPVSFAVVRLGSLATVVLTLPLVLVALSREALHLLQHALRAGVPLDLSELPLRVLALVAPIVGTAGLGALLLGLWQTGGAFSVRPLAWDWRRLSPFGSVGRAWSRTHVFSVASALLSTGLLAVVAFQVLERHGPSLAASVGSAEHALRLGAELCRELLLWSLLLAFSLAVADAVVTRSAWHARYRMSRQELRREQRESEGDPGLRQARQRSHEELAQNASTSELAGTTLLVLGRPHLAVALRYEPTLDAAPRVLISGSGALARTLENLAPVYGVPTLEDPLLARQLARLSVGQEIPHAQYAAVAALLESLGRRRAPGSTSV